MEDIMERHDQIYVGGKDFIVGRFNEEGSTSLEQDDYLSDQFYLFCQKNKFEVEDVLVFQIQDFGKLDYSELEEAIEDQGFDAAFIVSEAA